MCLPPDNVSLINKFSVSVVMVILLLGIGITFLCSSQEKINLSHITRKPDFCMSEKQRGRSATW